MIQFHRTNPILSILRAVQVVSVIVFFGACSHQGHRNANFGSQENIISYGIYTAQSLDTSGLSTKLSLNQNRSYSRKKIKGNCLLGESRGRWEVGHDAIEFKLAEVRKRNDCTNEDWRVENFDILTSRMIRNVTVNSFDILDQEEDSSAQWVHFVKH